MMTEKEQEARDEAKEKAVRIAGSVHKHNAGPVLVRSLVSGGFDAGYDAAVAAERERNAEYNWTMSDEPPPNSGHYWLLFQHNGQIHVHHTPYEYSYLDYYRRWPKNAVGYAKVWRPMFTGIVKGGEE